MINAEILVNPTTTTDKELAELYERVFPGVARFIKKHGGSLDDTKDIFHDALIIYYEKMRDEEVTILVSEEAYILGIAKHLWIRKYNNQRDQVSLDEMEYLIAVPEDYAPSPSNNRLLQLLALTGQRCMDFLKAFYYDKLSITEIVKVFGYTNEHTASVQKYKCLEKVRDKIKDKAISYEDLLE